MPSEAVASTRLSAEAPVGIPLWTRNAAVRSSGLRPPVMSMISTAGGLALFWVVPDPPSVGCSETTMYHVEESRAAGFVVSPNLKYVHVLPVVMAPPAPVVTTGNSSQSARSWTHCRVTGFHVNPRLAPPEGVAVGLIRTFT